MVIDDFDVRRSGRPARPLEADPPLRVDADTVLANTIAPQGFLPVASERLQFVDAYGRI
jgi:hypothetical protein